MSAAAGPIYVIDTSAIIAAWNERYPPDVAPRLWPQVAALIAQRRLISPDEVLNELERKSKEAQAWFKAQSGFRIRTGAELFQAAQQLLKVHPGLVAARKLPTSADPFVIVLAKARSAVVVTEEGSGGSKIRGVCNSCGMESVSLLQLIRAEKWTL